MGPGMRMCGTALTVHTRPADNLMLHKTLDIVQPGDVVAVCCESFTEAGGMFEGLMAASLKQKGCVV
jgi:4-hydroxy-4-methyl-2-oxoglutarate aldolase